MKTIFRIVFITAFIMMGMSTITKAQTNMNFWVYISDSCPALGQVTIVSIVMLLEGYSIIALIVIVGTKRIHGIISRILVPLIQLPLILIMVFMYLLTGMGVLHAMGISMIVAFCMAIFQMGLNI